MLQEDLQIYTVLQPTTEVDFNKYDYNMVYSPVDRNVDINGIIFSLKAGKPLKINVKNITEKENLYLLGNRKTFIKEVKTIEGNYFIEGYYEPNYFK